MAKGLNWERARLGRWPKDLCKIGLRRAPLARANRLKRDLEARHGSQGPASPVRRIDPKTGRAIPYVHSMRTIEVYFDGAAYLWKKAGYGFVVKEGRSSLTSAYGAVPCSPQTSTCNVAEHYALYKALLWLIENNLAHEKVIVLGDSQLVFFQLFRGWKCRSPRLPYYPYMVANKNLLGRFKTIKGRLLPRAQNGRADKLSKKGLLAEFADEPLIKQRH